MDKMLQCLKRVQENSRARGHSCDSAALGPNFVLLADEQDEMRWQEQREDDGLQGFHFPLDVLMSCFYNIADETDRWLINDQTIYTQVLCESEVTSWVDRYYDL